MSQENVEITERLNAAFETGGIEAVIEYFADDVVGHAIPEWPDQAEFRGHEGVRAMGAVWTENFDEFRFEVSERRDLGERVLTRGAILGEIRGSGVPIRQPLMSVFSDFRDGKIGEVHYFVSWPEALEFVGLDE